MHSHSHDTVVEVHEEEDSEQDVNSSGRVIETTQGTDIGSSSENIASKESQIALYLLNSNKKANWAYRMEEV